MIFTVKISFKAYVKIQKMIVCETSGSNKVCAFGLTFMALNSHES